MNRFDYDSVTFVPNALKSKSKSKSKSKGKGKGKGKGKPNPQSESAPSFQKNLEIPASNQTCVLEKNDESQRLDERKEKGKKKEVISDKSLTDHSGFSTKSMTTLTLPANMSKVAKACQKAQASSKPESLMWNEKKQVKTHMHEIVQYVYWMKKQRERVKLPEEPRIRFKVLFTLLEMKS
ncbi:uncharacterized protein BJ212DRAFT_1302783 [Suillus subaureus]|uniref:Uncharacterized protein n=1 Tax=Suillus subaureus TaxID=48587 RepID=A0A9P7J8J3_9AGAM|nr:uncharacterized protein BJ212DRAFT_1302783 [Suillus subaureus]KAG1808882.1 hypothetical protein BJ212DRAFT_1302783 [Suillus subaureus]